MFADSVWCPFSLIPSPAMAAMVAERCLFSLETLEFASMPTRSSFALIELAHHADWRWAIISSRGLILDEGHEPTETEAQRTAETALRLVAV